VLVWGYGHKEQRQREGQSGFMRAVLHGVMIILAHSVHVIFPITCNYPPLSDVVDE
jgi:hypothetical protein